MLKNYDLNTPDQFKYLSTLVTGPAASAISGLQASEEWYKNRPLTFIMRFGDKRIIVQITLEVFST